MRCGQGYPECALVGVYGMVGYGRYDAIPEWRGIWLTEVVECRRQLTDVVLLNGDPCRGTDFGGQ